MKKFTTESIYISSYLSYESDRKLVLYGIVWDLSIQRTAKLPLTFKTTLYNSRLRDAHHICYSTRWWDGVMFLYMNWIMWRIYSESLGPRRKTCHCLKINYFPETPVKTENPKPSINTLKFKPLIDLKNESELRNHSV